jgi:predicted acylesterase/phospholipase RssA
MEPDDWNPKGVSFSSGGVRTIGHLGVLSHLLSCGALASVRDWYGCSGGTFCALIGALGGTAAWIEDIIRHFDMSRFAIIDDELVLNFMSHFGVNSGGNMIEFMQRIINTWEPGCSEWTFADFAAKRPGITLTMIATNLTDGNIAVFNARNTPTMRLFDAMRASCAIPFYFTPWKAADGILYCDGAVLEVYPWNCVTDKANTLVVACSDNDIGGRMGKRHEITSLGDYMSCLYRLITKHKSVRAPKHWIAVNNRSFGSMDFHMTEEERFSLFQEGVAAAAGWNRFRKKVLSSERHGSHRPSLALRISSSGHPSPDKTLGNHQSCIPEQPPYPAQDSRTGDSPRVRRWSL